MSGAALTPGDVLVSSFDAFQVSEYTPSGTLVQSFNIPPAPGTASLRDVIVDPAGNLQIYNGTFTPVVTSLNPISGVTSNQTLSQFSTVNNISFGGIGVFGSSVFATDMNTANGGEAQGIVRFDLAHGTAVRFAQSDGYQDLTVGGDGLLYALPGQSLPASRIDVFNPNDLSLLRSINLGGLSQADLRGIAVGFNGTIYAVGWDGFVYVINSQGIVLNSRDIGRGNLTDIDVDATGRLVIGSRFGDVVLTDTGLANVTSFALPSGETVHVAWTVTIPEPGTSALTLLGLIALTAGGAAKYRKAASLPAISS